MEKLLGDKLIDNTGKQVATSTLKGKIVGLYFSASWCGPCRQFTPTLASTYNALQKEKKAFEVIFISSCKDEKSFKEYFATMPWKSLPYSDRAKAASLSQQYGISGIPTLVLLDPNGGTLSTDGRTLIGSQGSKGYPWGNKVPTAHEETEKKEKKAAEQKVLEKKQQALKAEPTEGDADSLTIQINCPSGTKTRRRFAQTDTIENVMQFVRAFDLTLASAKFVLVEQRPKKLYSDTTQTLQVAGMPKQANLFIQKL